jgi:DNA-3-methyladenine glycosylase I
MRRSWLFEKFSLRGFQSGLSWRTILVKREAFAPRLRCLISRRLRALPGATVERLLKDAGIVRHRGKIEAVINNARQARELVKREGSLAAFIWRYEPGDRGNWRNRKPHRPLRRPSPCRRR